MPTLAVAENHTTAADSGLAAQACSSNTQGTRCPFDRSDFSTFPAETLLFFATRLFAISLTSVTSPNLDFRLPHEVRL